MSYYNTTIELLFNSRYIVKTVAKSYKTNKFYGTEPMLILSSCLNNSLYDLPEMFSVFLYNSNCPLQSALDILQKTHTNLVFINPHNFSNIIVSNISYPIFLIDHPTKSFLMNYNIGQITVNKEVKSNILFAFNNFFLFVPIMFIAIYVLKKIFHRFQKYLF